MIELYPGIYKELSRRQTPRDAAACGHLWPTNDEGQRHRSPRRIPFSLPASPEPMPRSGRAADDQVTEVPSPEKQPNTQRRSTALCGGRRQPQSNLHATHHLGLRRLTRTTRRTAARATAGRTRRARAAPLPSRPVTRRQTATVELRRRRRRRRCRRPPSRSPGPVAAPSKSPSSKSEPPTLRCRGDQCRRRRRRGRSARLAVAARHPRGVAGAGGSFKSASSDTGIPKRSTTR